MFLRDKHGRDGDVVSASSNKTFRNLFWGGYKTVLYITVFRITLEGFQVQEFRDIGVGGRAVIALVKIVGQNLPVVFAI